MVMQVARHKMKNVYCISPPNRWPDRKSQPNTGRIPTQFRQLRPERLVSATPTSLTRVQLQSSPLWVILAAGN